MDRIRTESFVLFQNRKREKERDRKRKDKKYIFKRDKERKKGNGFCMKSMKEQKQLPLDRNSLNFWILPKLMQNSSN